MKQKTATVWLIVLNTLAFSAGVWAAVGSISIENPGVALIPSLLFLAVLPAPLIFVWRFFRDMYNFCKKKFFLYTVLPPAIVTAVLCSVLIVFAFTIGSTNGGYGGAAALALVFVSYVAKFFLLMSTVVWVSVEELFEEIKNDKSERMLAVTLLTGCSVFFFRRLYGLLRNGGIVIVHSAGYTAASYVWSTLLRAGVPALLIGFGASALMRVYRKEYSVKAPLFMLCSFLPTLLIVGVRMLLMYSEKGTLCFYNEVFIVLLDTLILTAAIAVTTAAFSALTAFIRNRRHYY